MWAQSALSQSAPAQLIIKHDFLTTCAGNVAAEF